jgi:hypothetical protein
MYRSRIASIAAELRTGRVLAWSKDAGFSERMGEMGAGTSRLERVVELGHTPREAAT